MPVALVVLVAVLPVVRVMTKIQSNVCGMRVRVGNEKQGKEPRWRGNEKWMSSGVFEMVANTRTRNWFIGLKVGATYLQASVCS